MGYQANHTPNSSTLPNDALIEIETSAGEVEHILGSVLNAIVNNAQTEIDAATRYSVIAKTASFTAEKSDGAKAYYRCSNAITITIQTQAAGGYNIGDEITFYNANSSAKTFDTSGLTMNLPDSFPTLEFNEQGSPIAMVCVGATEWDVLGDLSI